VVVPLDGSTVAEAILPFLLEIAGPLDMDLVLLRVIEPLPPTVLEGARQAAMEDVEGQTAQAEAYLAPIAENLRSRGVRARTTVRRGEPAPEIVEGAREVGADLIAMTTHGRSGLGRLVFGSVAEAVLRHADVPVFLMRQADRQGAARAARAAVR
jgi:nucleotide-binding universal stress UspA family protein